MALIAAYPDHSGSPPSDPRLTLPALLQRATTAASVALGL